MPEKAGHVLVKYQRKNVELDMFRISLLDKHAGGGRETTMHFVVALWFVKM